MKKIVFLWAILALSVSSFVVSAQTVDEILAKHQEAMGGAEKWSKVKSVIQNTKFTIQGMEIQSKASILVGKAFRSEIDVMGNKMVQVIEGENGWWIRPQMMGGSGEPEDMPKEMIKVSKNQESVGSLLLTAKLEGSKIDLVNKEKLDGADVYVCQITKKDGEVATAYVSASTHLILKFATKVNLGGQVMDTELKFSNYKAVDGLYFPFSMETVNPMGGGTMQVDTTSIEINPTLEAAIFVKPVKK
ncbi:LolA-like protein [Aquirufa aurantiipilula]|uniref:outer membrane lipoprotein-sorting protein n=1 Tax=Aquirufa aurantiipilula TaxID=2696561 RepID=UPI001CAA6655|nr:outer membrane lipoprotein-sorting protein [Aquirufa aurantiipilula]MBZ1327434.1 outer membrane lipoprotein-sorting protein [Aquirufa aurantiipilula]